MNGAKSGNTLHLHGVGKEYRLYDSPRARLKALLTGRALHRSHWALRDVSLSLERGQSLGVVGSNGAGKSTLLKLITDTLQPTTGHIERRGRITAILELGAGFHPEFTGRENLYFGGSLIGIDARQMRGLEPEVLAFAEIGEAIDRPVKTYSSGMVVRLAFALVTAVQPDVLIIDEALAVGDQHFQKKCVARIQSFQMQGCTTVFCSHSPYHVRQLCDTVLWLDQGQVMSLGETEPVLLAYETHLRRLAAAADAGDGGPVPVPPASANGDGGHPATAAHAEAAEDASIVSVQVTDLQEAATQAGGEAVVPRLMSPDLELTIEARGRGDECPSAGFMLEQFEGVGITSIHAHEDGARPKRLANGHWRWVLRLPDLPLHSGDYVISVYLFDASGLVVYDQWFQFQRFRFVAGTRVPGLVRLPHEWS